MTDEAKQALLDKLTKTRSTLTAYADSLAPAQWETAVYSDESQSEWTVLDLLRHVVDSEQSMTALMKQIHSGGSGVPEDFNLARWNARRIEKTEHKTYADLRADLDKNRQALLAFIDSLENDDWEKKGRHGSMRILSIAEICNLIANHEQSHIHEMKKVA
ncbi:MAG: DinB family protein [Anaerolineales bacterium]|nr:DinB family protein [Anaerolineales bacterium]